MSEVKFIRIRGRIVPIRPKKDAPGAVDRKVSGAKALGYTAAGVGAGYASGKVARNLLLKSAHLENESRTLAKKFRMAQLGPLFNQGGKAISGIGEESISKRIKSLSIFKSRLKVLSAGKFVAGALFGVAAGHAVKTAAGKDLGDLDDLVGSAVGIAASASVLVPYYRKLGALGKFGAFKAAAKNMRGIPASFLPKKRFF